MPEIVEIQSGIVATEQQFSSLPTINPEIISPSLLSTSSSRYKNLVTGLLAENGVKLTRRGLEIRFKDRIPLVSINISFEVSFTSTFTVEFTDDNGQTLELVADNVPNEPGKARVKIGRYLESFRIKSSGFSSVVVPAQLLKVEPIGFSVAAMTDLLEIADQQDALLNTVEQQFSDAKAFLAAELAKVKAEQDKLTAKTAADNLDITNKKALLVTEQAASAKLVAEKTAERTAIKAEIAVLMNDRTELDLKINSAKDVLEKLNSRTVEQNNVITTQDDLIERKNKEKTELSNEISDLQKDVKKWADNKNLFTAELDGVLGEYNQQAERYMWYACVPLLLCMLMAFELYSGASEMLKTIKPDIASPNIWTYAATRLPYVSVCVSIFLASLAWGFRPLLLKIFEIYDLRSVLQAKVMLITKLTREVSAKLDIPKEEEANILIDQKMKHIEETLSGHFGSNKNEQLTKLLNLEDVSAQSVLAKFISKVVRNQAIAKETSSND